MKIKNRMIYGKFDFEKEYSIDELDFAERLKNKLA